MKLNSDIRMVLDKNKTLEINDIDIKDFMKDMFSMLHFGIDTKLSLFSKIFTNPDSIFSFVIILLVLNLFFKT